MKCISQSVFHKILGIFLHVFLIFSESALGKDKDTKSKSRSEKGEKNGEKEKSKAVSDMKKNDADRKDAIAKYELVVYFVYNICLILNVVIEV